METTRLKDITGVRSGKLVATEFVGVRPDHAAMWKCQCDCGNTIVVQGRKLTGQRQISCGCARGLGITQHGHTKNGKGTPTYVSWQHMKDRCTNVKHKHYHNYGARGITVCESWQNFNNFLADMGERPPLTTLHRIDNDKPYSKENCKWSTVLEQNWDLCKPHRNSKQPRS